MADSVKRVLVTGANKGIGLATARAALQQQPDTHILLGSRDLARGEAAVQALASEQPGWQDRLSLVQIDVADANSGQCS